ncbi:MAG: AmmeMemoRadiSam system radical SAM enzyme [Spirochaetes bacterium]|nr:MAG: AmmeMemoRadiSam system radical SAM enzyme [Spirochaetota bacterium]
MKKEALYYDNLESGKVKCRLCPHNCTIGEGKFGICKARTAQGSKLYTTIYGEVSAIAMDPIEKKPLYHFFPGSSILSIGTVGCSFKCQFCQNYHISQNLNYPTDFYSPEEIAELALNKGSIGVAYTYSEPLIWYEYVYDASIETRKRGLKNVFVTNGYINQEPLSELLKYADAFNIDLKSFNKDFYRKVIGGKLEPVLETIEEVSRHPEIDLEVTTLVIPGYNDSDKEMDEITDFLASLNKDIPYHLSAYYPAYKFKAPPTPVETLERLKEIAERKLNYVYLGNVAGHTNTYCTECGALLIERHGYYTRIVDLKGDRCGNCGAKIPIIV